MPFITEELWHVTAAPGTKRASLLTLARWPHHTQLLDHASEGEIGWIIDLVTAIRSVRAEMNLTFATELVLVLVGVSAETAARAERWADVVKRLSRLSNITVSQNPPHGSVQLIVRGEVVALPLAGLIDIEAERARLEKELARSQADIARIDAKLGNADFVRRAPEEVVEGEREKREEADARCRKIVEALERLARMS
jgi:valyl-tRNA synthetase